MSNFRQGGVLLLKGLLFIALFCLLMSPGAQAQRAVEVERTVGSESLPVLNSQEVARLVLDQAPPDYPVIAKLNYIQGRVRLEVAVSPEGKVFHAHVVNGNPLFAAAVLNRAPDWRYRPLIFGGRPTSFFTVVEINFTLNYKDLNSVPPEPESDFSRQVKPPEVMTGAENSAASTNPLVHLRLLINREGKVIDSGILKGPPSLFETAKRSLEKWSFRPAHWGALPVPWYLDVAVPVSPPRAQAGAGVPDGF
jgi:TonB family protein